MKEYYIGVDRSDKNSVTTFYGSNTLESDIKEKEWARVSGDEIDRTQEKGRILKLREFRHAIAMIALSTFDPDENKDLVIDFEELERGLKFEDAEEVLVKVLQSENEEEIAKYFDHSCSSSSWKNTIATGMVKEEELHYLHSILMQGRGVYYNYSNILNFQKRIRTPISLCGIHGDIIKIAEIAIKRGIAVYEFKTKYLGISDEYFEDRIDFYLLLDDILKDHGIEIEEYYAVKKRLGLEEDLDVIESALIAFGSLSDEEKLDYYRELSEDDVIRLYNKDNTALLRYADERFSGIKEVDLYYGDPDHSYFYSYVLDQELAASLKEDSLIPLFMHDLPGINRSHWYTEDDHRIKVEISVLFTYCANLETLFMKAVNAAVIKEHSQEYPEDEDEENEEE